jgi:hypothetical protein
MSSIAAGYGMEGLMLEVSQPTNAKGHRLRNAPQQSSAWEEDN